MLCPWFWHGSQRYKFHIDCCFIIRHVHMHAYTTRIQHSIWTPPYISTTASNFRVPVEIEFEISLAPLNFFTWNSMSNGHKLDRSHRRGTAPDIFVDGPKLWKVKAAVVNIFYILTISQLTMSNGKGVACSDEPSENYHRFLCFLAHGIVFMASKLLFFVCSHHSFPSSRQLFSTKELFL